MFGNTRPLVPLLARFGAVAFALSACGYLVVTAQHRANPLPADTPASVEAHTIQAQPGPQNEMFLQGSKSLVLEAPADAATELETVETAETPAAPSAEFLPSSKVGVIITPAPATEPVFMPSSKSLRLEVSKPSATKPARPATEPPKNP